MNWSTSTTGLESLRIVFQAIVRIRYVVKNGAITANRSSSRQRGLTLNAIA